jgi:holo-[acyl-carrier protein] synthase
LGIKCGVDIIEVERIKKSLSLNGEIFRDKVFTPKEIEYCEQRKVVKYQSYAARFAAKEAVSKAFGTGISGGIDWKDIEVINDPDGKPNVVLSGRAQEVFKNMFAKDISLSLSHCENYAVAYVIIETENIRAD